MPLLFWERSFFSFRLLLFRRRLRILLCRLRLGSLRIELLLVLMEIYLGCLGGVLFLLECRLIGFPIGGLLRRRWLLLRFLLLLSNAQHGGSAFVNLGMSRGLL